MAIVSIGLIVVTSICICRSIKKIKERKPEEIDEAVV
jgi:hypothetical protein